MSWLRASQPNRTPSTRPATIWAQNGILGMRDFATGACEGADEDADTDTLHWCVSGKYGDGGAAFARSSREAAA
ncbi:hypothetical protein SLA_3188 [Streptomyces laurentii]|uniref:Uncharacterized protein n=1 Tax=Streptomyces laurentii TaxID=39478 RepID=A0A161JW54_STRLU|nr:hypothetical protein SLA_3188 [Streptomyces laurentii]